MRKLPSLAAAIVLCTVPVFAGPMAFAEPTTANGRVVVFSTELQELDRWEDPAGCQKLPAAAHVLINETDEVVNTYSDPLCLTPSVSVQPEYGTHVAPGTGSFSVGT
ncbi:hypothetical protein [Amycolatopsis sp. NPDC051102]|uniref:hypothetical protein n=1 Tax=Amycolatopsis sp. NPDC051102 TaxID=3155163 RepID=UPI00341EB9AF